MLIFRDNQVTTENTHRGITQLLQINDEKLPLYIFPMMSVYCAISQILKNRHLFSLYMFHLSEITSQQEIYSMRVNIKIEQVWWSEYGEWTTNWKSFE